PNDCLRHLVAAQIGGRRNALDPELELVDVRCPPQCLFVRDQLLLEETEDRLIERLHPVLRGAGGNRGVGEVCLRLVDDAVADECCPDHDFDGGCPAVPIGARDQALRDDRLQYRRQLQTYLFLLVGREHGDDTVDGFGRIQRVQG